MSIHELLSALRPQYIIYSFFLKRKCSKPENIQILSESTQTRAAWSVVRTSFLFLKIKVRFGGDCLQLFCLQNIDVCGFHIIDRLINGLSPLITALS